MALTSQELSRIDAELAALAPPRDCVERAWASRAETPLGDLALVDGALEAMRAGLEPAVIAKVARPREAHAPAVISSEAASSALEPAPEAAVVEPVDAAPVESAA